MLPLFNYLFNEEDNQERLKELLNDRRRRREDDDWFNLPDDEFRQLFRLTKDLAQQLIDEISPLMETGSRRSKVSIPLRVLTALRFFATGSYQRGIGCETGMAQPTVSNCIKEVSKAIEAIADRWVVFPQTQNEKRLVKIGFMEKFGFPGVVGCVDGTHVALLQPVEQEHVYFNRKGFHSKNVQIVCDSNLEILNVNANYGGSAHDSFIWRQSAVYDHLQQKYFGGDTATWLLGDSGYPQEPWLMTPYRNPAENSPEGRYNRAHIVVRNCVERCIGLLKTRFRCLLKERVLRYSPEDCGVIINACSVLHNMCVRNGVVLNDELVDEGDINENEQEDEHRVIEINEGRLRRNQIVNRYFNNNV